MRDFFKKTVKSAWFDKVTWGVIIAFSLVLLPEIIAMLSSTETSPYVQVLPQPVHTVARLLTCLWFAFEMAVRFGAEGMDFFKSRRNLFDLIMCALTAFISFCDWCAMLRLMRGIFTDSIEAPHRDERSGTMR